MLKMKTLRQRVPLFFLLISMSTSVFAAQTLQIAVAGPGGHSNGAYGNVNAVHAAARVVMAIEGRLPKAIVSNINGGNSVNSIASDARFTVTFDGTAEARQTLEQAVQEGCQAENAFRGVKEGDLYRGAAAHIRCTIE